MTDIDWRVFLVDVIEAFVEIAPGCFPSIVYSDSGLDFRIKIESEKEHLSENYSFLPVQGLGQCEVSIHGAGQEVLVVDGRVLY